jgi:hypothetical protein
MWLWKLCCCKTKKITLQVCEHMPFIRWINVTMNFPAKYIQYDLWRTEVLALCLLLQLSYTSFCFSLCEWDNQTREGITRWGKGQIKKHWFQIRKCFQSISSNPEKKLPCSITYSASFNKVFCVSLPDTRVHVNQRNQSQKIHVRYPERQAYGKILCELISKDSTSTSDNEFHGNFRVASYMFTFSEFLLSHTAHSVIKSHFMDIFRLAPKETLSSCYWAQEMFHQEI